MNHCMNRVCIFLFMILLVQNCIMFSCGFADSDKSDGEYVYIKLTGEDVPVFSGARVTAPISEPMLKPVLTPAPTSTTSIRSVPIDAVFSAKDSSEYKLKYNTEYTVGADMAVDNNLETAWNEGAKGIGIGEWIRVEPSNGERYTYRGFRIANGFQYHEYHKGDRWKKNNRVAELNVYADGIKLIGTFKIDDMYDGYQDVNFVEPVDCDYLVFEIKDVWKGADFSDTCISEIRPY